MALTFILPRDLDAAPSVGTSDVIPVDTGSNVVKATAAQIVAAGRPVASEAQAIAGTDNSTGMTPLTTRQAMEAFVSASSGITKLELNVSRFTADGTTNQFTISAAITTIARIRLSVGGEFQTHDRFTLTTDTSTTTVTWLGRSWVAGENFPKGWVVEWEALY